MRLPKTGFLENSADTRKDAATLLVAGIRAAILAGAVAQTVNDILLAGTDRVDGSNGTVGGLMCDPVATGPAGTDLADIQVVLAGSP